MGGVARVIKPPKPPAPPAPVYVPTPTKPEISQATMGKKEMARGMGRTSTILTGAKGLGDTKLMTSKQTLLGG